MMPNRHNRDNDSHRARAQKVSFQVSCGVEESSLWISWDLVLIIVMIKLSLHLEPFITRKYIFTNVKILFISINV